VDRQDCLCRNEEGGRKKIAALGWVDGGDGCGGGGGCRWSVVGGGLWSQQPSFVESSPTSSWQGQRYELDWTKPRRVSPMRMTWVTMKVRRWAEAKEETRRGSQEKKGERPPGTPYGTSDNASMQHKAKVRQAQRCKRSTQQPAQRGRKTLGLSPSGTGAFT
jgi:hypothetical protein